MLNSLPPLDPEVAKLLGQAVLFIDELALVLRTSRDTIERRLRRRVFPLKPLAAFDDRLRWATADVIKFLRMEGRVL